MVTTVPWSGGLPTQVKMAQAVTVVIKHDYLRIGAHQGAPLQECLEELEFADATGERERESTRLD